jgi:hypothetical protein
VSEELAWGQQRQIRTFAELDFILKPENIVFISPTGVGKTGLGCGFLLKALHHARGLAQDRHPVGARIGGWRRTGDRSVFGTGRGAIPLWTS